MKFSLREALNMSSMLASQNVYGGVQTYDPKEFKAQSKQYDYK